MNEFPENEDGSYAGYHPTAPEDESDAEGWMGHDDYPTADDEESAEEMRSEDEAPVREERQSADHPYIDRMSQDQSSMSHGSPMGKEGEEQQSSIRSPEEYSYDECGEELSVEDAGKTEFTDMSQEVHDQADGSMPDPLG